MTDETKVYERIVRLEVEVQQLQKEQIKMSLKVSDMYDILLQAKGVRWLLLGAATIGGFVAATSAKIMGIFSSGVP